MEIVFVVLLGIIASFTILRFDFQAAVKQLTDTNLPVIYLDNDLWIMMAWFLIVLLF